MKYSSKNTKYLVLVFYLYSITDLNSFNFDAVDIYSRTQLNDFFINLYYILWTNSWYLYLFLLIYVAVLTTFNTKTLNNVYLDFLANILLLFFLCEFLLYWDLNNLSCFVEGSGMFFNQLLSNSVNKFHPFLLYLTFVSVLTYPISNYSNFRVTWRQQFASNYNSSTAGNLHLNVLNLFFTLYLGSWWALQEGSWGGWWNWDPSEVLGLSILYFTLWTIHVRPNQLNSYASSRLSTIGVLTGLLLYYFVQLNFRLVSHNFGTKVVWFISPDQFNLLVVLFLIIVFIARVGNLGKLYINLCIFTQNKYKHARPTKPLFYLLLSLQVLLSFSILINDFCWSYFGLNILNTSNIFSMDNLILLVIIYLLSILAKPKNLHILATTYFCINFQLSVLLLYLLVIRISTTSLYHKLVLGLVILSYLSSNLSLSDWSMCGSSIGSMSYASLNNQLIEFSKYSTTGLFMCEKPCNFVTNTETSESIKTFISVVTGSNLSQTFVSGSDIWPILINVLEPTTQSLNLIFWVVWVNLVYNFKLNKLIIF